MKEVVNKTTFIDITGQKFNELTALEYIGNRMWKWRCSCGKECIARKNDVMLGKKKSCGHLCNRGVSNTIEVGQKFGEWEVIEKIDNRHIKCRCSCGTERVLGSYDLRNGNTKSCGHLSKGTGTNGRKDITGQRIGEWTVGEYIGDGYYKCTCSCGVVKNLKGTYLRTGQSKSCGHDTNAFKNIAGQKFGKWTAIKPLGKTVWECQCECGNLGKVSMYDLFNGNSTSCGCSRIPELLGKRFTKLTVTRHLGGMMWECQCDCGNKTEAMTANLLHGDKKSCGCLLQDKHNNIINNIRHEIETFKITEGQSPFVEDIANATGFSTTTIRKYSKQYSLEECFNKTFGSKYERQLYNLLSPYTTVELHNRKIIEPQELDLYLPEYKLAIEFNGDYWHSAEKVGEMYHQNKTIACAKRGIRLIHIFEHEWLDKEKEEKITKYILNIVHNTKAKIGARETNIKEIIDTNIVRDFLNKYHLQGYSSASIYLGCYSKIDNKLLGVLTLGTPRFDTNTQYEIIRLCWRDDIAVVGGTKKLFKYFVDTYNPKSAITYSDISKFTGNVYTSLGFKPLTHETFTKPNYIWINEINGFIMTRYQAQKKNLIQMGLGTEQQTENEIMVNNNFIKVYDCGSIKLEWIA